MPLLTTLRLDADCTAVLWRITEAETDLRAGLPLTPDERADVATITHPAQRVEWLACRAAVQQLIVNRGGRYVGLRKDAFGKPHLIGWPGHVSLSHTGGWAAAVVHQTRPVGLDIEPIRPQFERVVPRVLSEDEIRHAAGDVGRLAVYWCAKEALYKLYGKRQLTFREHLLVEPFADGADRLTGHVRQPNGAHSPAGLTDQRVAIRCFRAGPGLLTVAY